MNIKRTSEYGFGREARRRAADKRLDQIIAKLETKEPLRLKTPKSWQGKAQRVYNSRNLAYAMQRQLINLRLSQLASQQAKDSGGLNVTRAYKPHTGALAVIPELKQVWRANSRERLQQALDKAQSAILKALDSDDPQKQMAAARLMLRTKQGRERGFTDYFT
jgi:hypothetical protein